MSVTDKLTNPANQPTEYNNILSNLLEDDLVQPQKWLMHHMPATYIFVIREVALYYFVNYTEQEVKKERNRRYSSQNLTMMSTDLRVGVFNDREQIHYIIFCKCWVFPALKIILP